MTIADRYQKLLAAILSHAAACGRAQDKILLLAVTKGRSAQEIVEAYQAGARDFGENKMQEATDKRHLPLSDARWHFIGTLQKNKVRKAIGKFHLIHSVNSLDLAKKIASCSREEGTITSALLQVNTSQEKTKQGFSCQEIKEQFQEIRQLEGLAIQGLMTMAPLTKEEDIIRTSFRKLRQLRDELQETSHVHLSQLSMGMSNDWRLAVEEGATILRIGSALFS